ncbi:ATP-binding protein [Micrococcaceae sp. AOP34-BR2-30]
MNKITDFTADQIAAAGGHNLLVAQGPGGKAANTSRPLDPGNIVTIRPSTTAATIFGTIKGVAKGQLEKAHQGTVILDDATRFTGTILDSIHAAYDTKRVRLYKGDHLTVNEPADFRMIIATRGRDQHPLPGQLLDRVDIITTKALGNAGANPATLETARATQADRLTPYGITTNATAPIDLLLGDLHPGHAALARSNRALESGQISLRALTRTLRTAWTLADLTGATTPTAEHITIARVIRTL